MVSPGRTSTWCTFVNPDTVKNRRLPEALTRGISLSTTRPRTLVGAIIRTNGADRKVYKVALVLSAVRRIVYVVGYFASSGMVAERRSADLQGITSLRIVYRFNSTRPVLVTA